MSNLTSAVNVMVDTETKKQATSILSDLGLSMSTAINLFLKQVVKRDGLPFEVVNPKPNKEMMEALLEAEAIENGTIKVNSYKNREDLKKALLSDD